MAKKKALPAPIVHEPEVAQVVHKSGDGGDGFWDDPKKEEALKLALHGMPKTHIATKVSVHRNTINNWFTHPVFVGELNQRMREHMAATRVRRLQATNNMTNRIERITMALAEDVEEKLHIDKETGKPHIRSNEREELGRSVRLFREMGYEFREMREQERKDYGDDVKKVAINQQTTITGDVNVQHHGVNDVPFTDFIKRAIDERVIDVEAIEAPSDGQLLLKAAEHVLVDSDLLEQINEEDKAAEEASKG